MTFVEASNMEDAINQVVEHIKGSETIGNQRADEKLQQSKIIIAKAVKDWVKPYANVDNIIPIVLMSTHPRFKVGTRLDYGFHSILYKEGYTLIVIGKDEK